MEISMTIWLPKPRVVEDGELYSAYCDNLELASSGISRREAIRNLTNAVKSYCKSLDDIGILEKRLEEKGVPFEILDTGDISRKGLQPVLV